MGDSTKPLETLEILAQADLLLLLARTLDRPDDPAVDDESLIALVRSTHRRGAERSDALRRLRRIVRAAERLEPADWIAEHSRLFDGPILCPPNETAYVRRDKGAVLADISGFYTAFGFRLSERTGEKADHVVSELEFLALLLVMLAEARGSGSEADEAVALAALQAFASEHLDEWLPLFIERLVATTALKLYRDVAVVLLTTWETVLAAHDVPRTERVAKQLPDADLGTPYECGMAEPSRKGALLSIQDPGGAEG